MKFSQFIDKATNGKVPASALEQGLQVHVNQLIGAFNDYVKGDYASAYKTIDMAYGHMYDSAKALSNGIVSQYPNKFKMSNMPSAMPHTGFGGAQKTDYFEWVLAALVALAGATVIFAERRANKEQ